MLSTILVLVGMAICVGLPLLGWRLGKLKFASIIVTAWGVLCLLLGISIGLDKPFVLERYYLDFHGQGGGFSLVNNPLFLVALLQVVLATFSMIILRTQTTLKAWKPAKWLLIGLLFCLLAAGVTYYQKARFRLEPLEYEFYMEKLGGYG